MKNNDLLSVMQSAGRLDIVHVGDKPEETSYAKVLVSYFPKGSIGYKLPFKPILKSRRFAKVIGNELHVRKYEDPSHGWLAVPMQWLEQLGIVGKISAFSFLKGSTAYLEEDGDMSEFYKAAKNAGFTLFIDYHHTDKTSPVRSYPPFPQKG